MIFSDDLDPAECCAVMNGLVLHQSLENPAVLRQFEFVQTDGELLVLLELAENGPLAQFVGPKVALSESLALQLISDVAEGLHFLHRQGLVHRSVNPRSVFLDSEFRAKLGKFSSGARLGTNGLVAGVAGPFEYMSPEMALEQLYDEKVDMWSLGCLLFELLEGVLIRQKRVRSN